MRVRSVLVAVAAVAVVPAFLALTGAQGGGLTGINKGGSGVEGSVSARAPTPFEEFAGKLKLDEKSQQPAAIEIINAAATEASPVGAQILQIRQRILNGELAGSADDVKTATAEYVTAEAKMATIEANAFAKVLALTKPDQQKDAAQAFALMAGFFQRQAPAGRGGR